MRFGWKLLLWLNLASLAFPATQPDRAIVTLYDAFGKEAPGAEQGWGYSVLLRFQGKTILFDSGGDADRFARNIKALGVDLKGVDFAVLSHSHGDHGAGFDYVLKVNPTLKLYVPNDRLFGGGAGLPFPKVPLEVVNALPPEQRYFHGVDRTTTGTWGSRYWKARTEIISANKEIAPGLFLLATTSPLMGDFSRPRPEDQPALNGLPELSLALVTSKGTVLVTGCSHSGIESIVRQTRQTLPGEIQLVTGGFHLLPNTSEEIQRIAHRMKDDLAVRRVAPAHCSGMLAFHIFHEVYGTDYIPAGLGSQISFEP
jgi:7,8-dihydropterin-6-yl-methyl-4-(beta-D-ribofuranosyl)aminobenzene 5'-phosphate synthase